MTRCWPATLTARLAILFTITAIGTFTAVGAYLYHALATQLEHRETEEMFGKLAQFRHVLEEASSMQAIANDTHRFLDVAAGHDGLDVVITTASGQVLMQTQEINLPPLDFPMVAVGKLPSAAAIEAWPVASGTSARILAAWAAIGQSSEPVRVIVARTTTERIALLEAYRQEVIWAALSGAVLSALLGFGVAQRSIRPVRSIAHQARLITAERLHTRLDAGAVPSEVQDLVHAFNAVLDRLQDSFARLSQVSADLAHDLRTPLYNLSMQTQVALSQRRTVDEYQALLTSNLEEFERLTRMAENMLFLARADNAQVALSKRPLQAADELRRVAEYFEGIAEDAGVKIEVSGSAFVVADRTLVRRALGNLVANAIRYTASGKRIELSARQTDQAAELWICNPGPGIDARHLSHLFDRFYRADQSRTHSAESTGLGLAIVHSIMNLHQGRVEVESVPGQITTFRLVFPT